MRHRLFSALSIAVAVALAVPASADALGKPQARSKANAKVRNYLANHAWANRARVGKCRQRGKRKVLCRGAARSKQRVCRLRIVVWGKRPRAKLRRGKCFRRAARPLGSPVNPSRILRLSAWLGEPGRKALDPFEVTYPHGATTTAQVASLEGEPEPTPTPPGVLALYVDGVLECAANVNEANPEATCPVDYDELGTYRVTTIYTSGSESAADTINHDVDPLPTETTLALSYSDLPGGPLALSEGPRCKYAVGGQLNQCGFFCHFVDSGGAGSEDCVFQQEWQLGTLTISASSNPAGAVSLQCDTGPCASVPHTLEGNATAVILMYASGSGTRFPAGNKTPPTCQWMKEHAVQWTPDLTSIGVTATPVASGYVDSGVTRNETFSPTLAC